MLESGLRWGGVRWALGLCEAQSQCPPPVAASEFRKWIILNNIEFFNKTRLIRVRNLKELCAKIAMDCAGIAKKLIKKACNFP